MTESTWATTLPQAVTVATRRADRTGVRQRVSLCDCDRGHYIVKPVDRIPAGAL
jgi:hypothetical protein